MKRFVIGDIHGRYEALREVLQKSKFNYKKDKLIVLGDIVDGGDKVYDVVEELLKIKNLIFVRGNHDEWFIKFMNEGFDKEIWLQQGGKNTIRSYGGEVLNTYISKNIMNTTNLNIPITHQNFFNQSVLYYIEDKMLFVHGGINPKIPKITSQSKIDLLWDRNLINYCSKGKKVPNYDKIFVGHTATHTIINNIFTPINFGQLWCMDTGAGWDGLLTIMNIDTLETFKSKFQKVCR